MKKITILFIVGILDRFHNWELLEHKASKK